MSDGKKGQPYLLATSLSVGLVFALGVYSATAVEPVVADAACHLDQMPRPVRQTIVVIDQTEIDQAADGLNENNRRWINTIVDLAGVQEGQASNFSAPRERITVLLASQDGGELVRVFAGCPPTFSSAEFKQMEEASKGIQSKLDIFLGRDAKSRAAAEQKGFRVSLLGALVQLARTAPKQASDEVTAPILFDSFASINRAFDVSNGIPRIILIAPFNGPSYRKLQSIKDARERGFDYGTKTSADLQRAEVYVTGVARDSNKLTKEFANAFFLAIKGNLIGYSNDFIPNVTEPPDTVQVFGGLIDYAGVKAPMQLRLAIDKTGSLVNSWVEISLDRATATPLSGKVVCKNEYECSVTGDGKGFSQSWVSDPGPTPKFNSSLPFSGIRYFEFKTDRDGVRGRFYDPLVVINGKKELPFELARTAQVRF